MDKSHVAPDVSNIEDESRTEPSSQQPARRAYEPPTLFWTEPFQPVAYGMACAKQAGQQFICDTNPNLS